MTNVSIYSLAMVVAVAELSVLFVSAYPDVPEDYRRYFIERSTNCWTRDVPGERRLNQNLPLFTTNDPHGILGTSMTVCGWLPPDASGMWSWGPEAALRFDVSALAVAEIDVYATMGALVAPSHPEQIIEILSGGRMLTSFRLTSSALVEQRFVVPAEVVAEASSSKLDLWFYFPTSISPRELGINSNGRKHAVRLTNIRLEAIAPQ